MNLANITKMRFACVYDACKARMIEFDTVTDLNRHDEMFHLARRADIRGTERDREAARRLLGLRPIATLADIAVVAYWEMKWCSCPSWPMMRGKGRDCKHIKEVVA